VTRGFQGRPRRPHDHRLPPGQYDAGRDWPVLNIEPTPRLDPEAWTFTVDGAVEEPRTWTWDDVHDLPTGRYEGPIHCVTTWSRFETAFAGVSLDDLLDPCRPRPEARFVLARAESGYATNLALADVTGGRAWVVWEADGRPLEAAHGGPARLLVPHLYLWKSVKWVTGISLLEHEELGFWERNGYHVRGDPWAEQRYSSD
jgi:DMSO/TMAO reductase YedYZ molybdopterin-dependent catalytic subunit